MQNAARIPGLPAPRTALIGRERDLDIVRDILADADTRLLTFTGVGGCGKTRLAFQLTTDLAPDYPRRAWAVELAHVGDPDLVPIVVASSLGLREASSTSSMASVTAFLSWQPALLLLDNCEHLIDACAEFVDALLSSCPDLRVLATSREPLHIAGERQYRVPPLTVPDLEALGSVDEIAAFPAVQLFVTRTKAVLPSFDLTSDIAVTVAGICGRLEGIPLALELAAARVRVLGVEQILERLDSSFQVLTGGSRVAPTRHQTLRAALEWSDALLTEIERVVFRYLAVFAGEFQLPAVEALCADLKLQPDGLLDVLTGLVDKSLVVVASEDRLAWYRLLEPVRQYALEQLTAAGELEIIRRRHGEYYLDLAEQAAVGLEGPEHRLWMDRLERELDNLRAALEWTRLEDDGALELRLATALGPFWSMHNRGHHVVEGLQNLRRALARDLLVDDLALRARALAYAGRLAFFFEHSHTSQFIEAEAHSRAGLDLARESGDDATVALALTNLGMIHRMESDVPRSVAALEEALASFGDQSFELDKAFILMNLGIGVNIQGNHIRGERLLQESLSRFQALGSLLPTAIAQTLLGWTASYRGEFHQAIRLIADALTAHQYQGDRWFVAWDLFVLADVVLNAGYAEQGVRLMGAAQAQSDRLGRPVGGVSDERALAQINILRSKDWFESVWAAGYDLDQDDAVQVGLSLPDELASRGSPGEPASPDFTPLSPRESEVARLLAEGHTDREIADALFIAVGTVGVHVHHILKKLELQSRVQVAGWLATQELDTGNS